MKYFSWFITSSVLLLTSSWACANDIFISGTSGSPVIMDREHTSIQMVREKISIDVLPLRAREEYIATVDFVFRNHGAQTAVRMGFPEQASDASRKPGAYRNRTSFKTFASWVDGRRIRAWRIPVKSTTNVFQTYWVKNVAFKKNQTRHIRVRYRSNCATAQGGSFVPYDFTGANWKGEVEKSSLVLKFRKPGSWYVQAVMGNGWNPVPFRQSNNTFRMSWKHWQARAEFYFTYFQTVPRPLWLGTEYRANNSATICISPVPTKYETYYQYLPTALIRDKGTFVTTNLLKQWVSVREKKTKGKAQTAITWDKATKRQVFQTHDHRFEFAVGRKEFFVDGRQIHNNLAPMRLYANEDELIFVPLQPFVDALNGRMRVDLQGQRLWFNAP